MEKHRKWHWVDWIMFGFWVFLLIVEFLSLTEGEPSIDLPPEPFIAYFILNFFLPFTVWRPGYVNTPWLLVLMLVPGSAIDIFLSYYTGDVVGTMAITALIIGFYSGKKYVWYTAPWLFIIMPAIEVFGYDKIKWDLIISAVLNTMLTYGIGFSFCMILLSNFAMRKLLDENRKQYELIQEQNNTLEQYSNQVEQLTLLEERDRVARDLHDTIGHTFTTVIMGMDAISYLIEISPEKAKERLDILRSVTRKGLEEVRKNIHEMASYDDNDKLFVLMSRLCSEFAVHTGTQVKLLDRGEEYDLPKHIKLTLIRCLQESLTNAKRHGNAHSVEVYLHFTEQQVILTVSDNGKGTDQLKNGFGLTAMKERLHAVQGTLDAHSRSGEGTVITCRVPITSSNRIPAKK